MANGFCLPLMRHIEALTGTDPAKKIPLLGFTQMLLNGMDGSVSVLNDGTQNGHKRPVKIKYRKRPLESSVKTTPGACEVVDTASYDEFDFTDWKYREKSIYIEAETIRQYCEDASRLVSLPNGSTGPAQLNGQSRVMEEVYNQIIEAAGVLMRSINTQLVTSMSTQWGHNLVTGNNNAVQIPWDITSNAGQKALLKVISDIRENEFCNDFLIVGNGDLPDFDMVKSILDKAGNGIDNRVLGNLIPQVWFDKATRSLWGNNQFGVFEKGSLALVHYNLYDGNFNGKWAASNFFTMPFPTELYNCPQDSLNALKFDVQIKEFDCPTQLTVDGQASTTVGPGIMVTLSKNFGLFVKPDSIFEATDPLYGTNGTLRYETIGAGNPYCCDPEPCPAPDISNVNYSDSVITITGTNFSSSGTVTVGGTAKPFTVSSDGTTIVIDMLVEPGTTAIVVSNDCGQDSADLVVVPG